MSGNKFNKDRNVKFINSPLYRLLDDSTRDKLASTMDEEDKKVIAEYERIGKEAKQHPRDEVVLILAATPWEQFGPNDNGDALYSKPFFKIKQDATLPVTHRSFETKAMISKNHQYQTPDKAIGGILKAIWNEKYKRVEVLAIYYWNKALSECNRIRKNKALMCSMGYRICSPELPPESGEYCSYCGKHARRTEERCSHLSGLVGSIVDGIPVFMMNGKGFFVDLSSIVIPGDFNSRTIWRLDPNSGDDSEK
jgi:hypothetical protein